MRCYIQISSWKDNIPRHFVVEALKGIETVRKEQTKYSNSQVASNTIANEVAARSRSVGVSRVQAPPKRLYNSTNELVEPTSSANMAQYSSERISDTNLKDFAENPQDLESVATTERTKEENSANDPIIVDNTKAVP